MDESEWVGRKGMFVGSESMNDLRQMLVEALTINELMAFLLQCFVDFFPKLYYVEICIDYQLSKGFWPRTLLQGL